jgi:hypothetical protein
MERIRWTAAEFARRRQLDDLCGRAQRRDCVHSASRSQAPCFPSAQSHIEPASQTRAHDATGLSRQNGPPNERAIVPPRRPTAAGRPQKWRAARPRRTPRARQSKRNLKHSLAREGRGRPRLELPADLGRCRRRPYQLADPAGPAPGGAAPQRRSRHHQAGL